MKKFFLILIMFVSFSNLFSQGTGGSNAKFEYRRLVDLPTAGVLEKGFAGVTLDVMPMGVVITRIEVGVADGFSFGISYGGANVIGTGDIDWNKLPGVNIRARIIDESVLLPAIAFGFDSQGKGNFDKDLSRYQIKSPGFFLAVSKNFELLGYLSVHGVINYSFERDDADKDLNLGVGFEKTIGSKVSLVGEYDLAVNDNTGNALGKGSGYLNFGIRWSIGEGLTLGIDLRDFLKNKQTNSRADRGLFVEYLKSIF
jgi:hypothetical protein